MAGDALLYVQVLNASGIAWMSLALLLYHDAQTRGCHLDRPTLAGTSLMLAFLAVMCLTTLLTSSFWLASWLVGLGVA